MTGPGPRLPPPLDERRPPKAWLPLLVAVTCSALLVGGVLAVDMTQKARVGRLSRSLDQRIAARSTETWERPPLRGEAEPGNAAVDQRAVVDAIGPLDPDAFKEAPRGFADPAAMPPALARLADAKRASLLALRATTRRGQAVTPIDLRVGAAVPVPPLGANMRASKLLLVSAVLSPPGPCLEQAADAMRLMQDAAPGVGMIGAMTAAASTTHLPLVAQTCARQASPGELRKAAAEFRSLAAHHPPIGRALRDEMLLASVELRRLAQATPVLPLPGSPSVPLGSTRSGPEAALDLVRQRPLLLSAWEATLAMSSRWEPLTAASYPGLLEQIERDEAEMVSRSHYCSDFLGSYRRYLEHDAQGHARLRVVASALELLADGNGKAPSPGSAPSPSAELVDPFSGDPLRLRPAREGERAALYSIGPDRHDDGGRPGTDDIAFEL